MKPLYALLIHELRNARSSLLAAAVLTIALLIILHVFGCTPTDLATGLPFVWCLCALQFAADAFATDLASGRLATRATLPVSARTLWGAKLIGFVTSIALLSSFGIAVEFAWQTIFGRLDSCREFIGALPSIGAACIVLALIGACGMLCSLIVESALTAMLLTGLVLGALWGLWLAAVETVKLTGPNLWTEHPSVAVLVLAGTLLAIGLLAFTRSQRKLGDGAIRVRTVLIGALVLVLGLAGTATATSIHWSTYALEDRRTDIFPPIASPDGRFIAFETMPSGGARDVRLSSVWVLDLETCEHHLLAGPGMLIRNGYSASWMPWTEESGLCVLVQDRWLWAGKPGSLRIRARSGELREEPAEDLAPVGAPLLPEWATVTDMRTKKPGVRSLRIQWKGTEFERTLEGHLGYDVFVSPTPGRILVRHDDRLVLADIASREERTLIGSDVGFLSLSPDGQALVVCTKKLITHVISTVDGSALHAPWRKEDSYGPRWIPGDICSHLLHLSPRKPGLYPHILDLDTGREIEVADHMNDFFARVADRGYVMLDEQGDLVWIDREGKLVKVLIDRGVTRDD